MDTQETALDKLLDEANPTAKDMADIVLKLKETAEKVFGATCDLAVAIVPHSDDPNRQRALAVTPEGTPIETAARTMWLSLGALQVAMHEAGMSAEAMGEAPTNALN